MFLTILTTDNILLLQIMSHLPHLTTTSNPPTPLSAFQNNDKAPQPSYNILRDLQESPMAIHSPMCNVHCITHSKSPTEIQVMISNQLFHRLRQPPHSQLAQTHHLVDTSAPLCKTNSFVPNFRQNFKCFCFNIKITHITHHLNQQSNRTMKS